MIRRLWHKKRVKLLTFLTLSFLIYILLPFWNPLVPEDYSVVIKDKHGKIIRAFLNDEEQWCFPPTDSIGIPYKLRSAVILFEDQYFDYHPGVNPMAIFRAFQQNMKSDKIESGASTITMQVARMDKKHKRTYWNKVKEIFKSLKIEARYSKNEILQLYLDHAPYGGNIIGYQAASLKYFRKDPSQLSWAEAATLAILPNAPGMISPSKNPENLRVKRDRLLKRLYEEAYMDKNTYELALIENIPNRSYAFQQSAHHLTEKLAKKYKGSIQTTLDKDIQLQLEQILAQYVLQQNLQGIRNGSAIILDTKTGGVLAYAGSQSYYDQSMLGMVDGVTAKRSSGSLLKPFLFALSIDYGTITPNTLIKDIPTYYGAYSPKNYNKDYAGLVKAKDALTQSLNIPAVRLLNSYGVYPFYEFLKEAGISTLFRSSEDYGLPLIIGGAEVKLIEMAMLYRGLANNGYFEYPKIIQGEERTASKQLISPGACYLTLEALKQVKRPGLEYHWEAFSNQQPIAWKTGTSYGHKDAWAAGVTPQYTIGVWLGNFDGEGNANLIGTTSAGPLLFQILNRLTANQKYTWFKENDQEMKELKICSKTGFTANQYCPETEMISVPQGMQPNKICPYHVQVEVSENETEVVCSHCWNKDHHPKVYEQYPTDVLLQLNKKGVSPEAIPNHKITCKVGSELNKINIVYPTDSSLIWIPRDFDGAYQEVVAKAATVDQNSRVFWYVNDKYLGETNRIHTKAIQLPVGKHTIVAKSDKGSEHTATFYIVKHGKE